MQIVMIMKEVLNANVMMDTRVMVFNAWIEMNAQFKLKQDHPHVIMEKYVLMKLVSSDVFVLMEQIVPMKHALILMNVLLELTIVTVKPCVSIILVHLNVNVLMDMLVMASNVLILTNALLLKLILGNYLSIGLNT